MKPSRGSGGELNLVAASLLGAPARTVGPPLAVAAISLLCSIGSSKTMGWQPPAVSPPLANRESPAGVEWVTARVRAPRVSFHTFTSAAAKAAVSYHLYTPQAYSDPANADRRFPVVYWLHGSGGSTPGLAAVAANFDTAISAAKLPPCLVVFVNGLVEGMYVDWKDGRAPLESVIVGDLVPHIDESYRTLADRRGRVLDGFSMGGYGAARLGFKHTHLFGAVSVIGAGPMQEDLLDAPRAGRQRAAQVLARVFGGDPEYFRAVSPRHIATENAADIATGSLIRLVIGDKDETFGANRAFHDHLDSLKIPHSWTVLPGVAHEPMGVLSAMGDDNWAFYRQAFAVKLAEGLAEVPADRPTPPTRDQSPRRGMIAEMNTFKTDVPAHPWNIVLVRPTPTAMGVSVLANVDSDGYIEFGPRQGVYDRQTPPRRLAKGEPSLYLLDGLSPETTYSYRLRSRSARSEASKEAGGSSSAEQFDASPAYTFCTPPTRVMAGGAGGGQAAKQPAFTFTVQADSHLDPNVTPAVYVQSLANALADKPAFHIDLGDTFMTDKRGRNFTEALPSYIAQRYYFGQLCHSAPLFMVLGNHDGEVGYASDGPQSMAIWSFNQRTKYFPAPQITPRDRVGAGDGEMYSGRTSLSDGRGANYYEFTWGDAQFLVLDPFWFTTTRPKGGGGGGGPGRDKKDADVAGTDDNWSRTLGKEQYDWLARTLQSSTAKHRFVFIHHLVGGLGRANRGGAESSVFFEWGGNNADGSQGFAVHRPGWAMPIHDLLVRHKVAAVFHGHDHLYVRSERDGVVYQCVPQPGNIAGGTRSAEEYGYKSGTIYGSPGYLRVRVEPEKATVEFVRSAIAGAEENRRGDRREGGANGSVIHRYQLTAQSK